jgi:hypothetical protein
LSRGDRSNELLDRPHITRAGIADAGVTVTSVVDASIVDATVVAAVVEIAVAASVIDADIVAATRLLFLDVRGLLEFLHTGAETTHQLGDLATAEEDENDQDNDDDLWCSESHEDTYAIR